MGPLSALIRTANAISGQITSFRLVMTEPWTLSEVITGKSGCERGHKKKGGVMGDWQRRGGSGEGDGIGWQSILIWSQKRGRGTERHSCAHDCVCESRLNWQRCQPSRQVHVTQIEGRRVSLAHTPHTQVLFLWAPNLYRQAQYISDHKTTPPGRSGGTAVFHDGDKDKCVIVGEVTGADRPFSFVWDGRMDGWTDGGRGRETCLWVGRCQKKRGEMWRS